MGNISKIHARILNRDGNFLTIQILACLLPLIFFLVSTFVLPRPYYITEMDFEQDYYYNSRMIAEGIPLNYHHPGTPIYYLGNLLFYILGTDPSRAQVFFHWGYLIVAAATAFSLVLFSRMLLRGLPTSVSVLILATIVVWPPFLTYSNYFGSDSFIVAAGLPTVTLFWKKLESFEKNVALGILCGIGIGLCLAIKMTFLPLVAALFISAVIHAFLSVFNYFSAHPKKWRKGLSLFLSQLVPLVFCSVISYLIFTAPVFNRLRYIWVKTFTRQDAFPPSWNLPAEILETFRVIFNDNPLFSVILVLLVIIFMSLVSYRVMLCYFPTRHELLGKENANRTDTFDSFSGAVFLVLITTAFVYVSAAAVPITPGAETGVRLRNISPCALFFPFMILYCYRYAHECLPTHLTRHSFYYRGIFAVAVSILLVGWVSHFMTRHEIINDHLKRIGDTRKRLGTMALKGDRIAFWTESDQDMLGDVSFHFWGNYRYARNYFDNSLLQQYPSFAFFKLRNVRYEISQARRKEKHDNHPETSSVHSQYGVIGDMYWQFRGWLESPPPDPDHWKIGGILNEGVTVERVAVLAFPASELDEFNNLSESEDGAIELLRKYLGLGPARKEMIDGIEWVLMEGTSNPGLVMLPSQLQYVGLHLGFPAPV
jgi:hypothetical protein